MIKVADFYYETSAKSMQNKIKTIHLSKIQKF